MVARDFLLAADPGLVLAAETPVVDPAPTKQASTVMLLRDDDGPLQVFMLRRVPTMDFAASRHVFPGGGVDPRDAEETPWAGPDPEVWAERLGTDEAHARMLVAAAVREVFEETGVLLASPADDPGGDAVVLADDESDRLRESLVAKEVALGEVLLARGLVLRSDLLGYRAHWITPEFEKRRYDTYFFVAALPAGQSADGRTSEADVAEWVRPRALLDFFAAGDALLLPPTIVCLEGLAEHASVGQALGGEPRVATVLPQLVLTDAGPAVRIEPAP